MGQLGDSLHRRKLQSMLESALRKKISNMGRRPAQGAAAASQPGAGFTVKPTGMISATQPTAADYQAKTNRMELDRKYGSNDASSRYYKGRWETPAQRAAAQATRANAAKTDKEAAEFQLKLRKDAREERKLANSEKDLFGVPGDTPVTPKEFKDGKPLGQPPAQQQIPTTPIQKPLGQQQAPTGFPKPDAPMTQLATNTGGIRVPEGAWDKKIAPPGYYAMNQAGQTKFTPPAAQTLPPAPMDPQMWTEGPGVMTQDVVKKILSGIKKEKPQQGPASTNNLLKLGEWLKEVIGRTPM